MTRANGLPEDVPELFAKAAENFSFAPAETPKPAKFDAPIFVRSSGPQFVPLDALHAKSEQVRKSVRENDPSIVREAPSPSN